IKLVGMGSCPAKAALFSSKVLDGSKSLAQEPLFSQAVGGDAADRSERLRATRYFHLESSEAGM
ncbi:MAG: hypothetical protein WBZ33_14015, partial [Thermoactinomyces sp.]